MAGNRWHPSRPDRPERPPGRCSLLLLTALASGAAGCPSGAGAAPPIGGADARVEHDPATTSMFLVAAPADAARGWAPVQGALVALDAPDGSRQQRTSRDDGRVFFDAVDWAQGPHTITVYKAGYVMTSHTAVTEATLADGPHLASTRALWLSPAPAPDPQVRVGGVVVGALDRRHSVLVNVLGSGTATDWLGADGDPFEVSAPRSKPFVLQALEYLYEPLPLEHGHALTVFQVAHLPMARQPDDLQGVELDLRAYAMTTHTAGLSWPLTARAASPLRSGTAVCVVALPGSRFSVGWATRLALAPEGDRFEIAALWVEPDWAEEPETQLRIHAASGQLLALVTVPGYPKERMAVPGALDAPDLGHVTSHPAGAPLAVTWRDPEVQATGLDVLRDGTLIWHVSAGPTAATMTLPEPPTGLALEDVLPEHPRLYVWGADVSPSGAERWTRSLDIALTW